MSNNSEPCASDVIEYEEYSMVKQILKEKGFAEASPSRISHIKEKFSLITRIGGMQNKEYKSTWFFKKGPEYCCYLQIITRGPKNRKEGFITAFVFGHNKLMSNEVFSRKNRTQKNLPLWLSQTDYLLSEKHSCPGCGAKMNISRGVLICDNIRRHEREKTIAINPVDGTPVFCNKQNPQTFRTKPRSFVAK